MRAGIKLASSAWCGVVCGANDAQRPEEERAHVDLSSLRIIREMLTSEYAHAVLESNNDARIMYGLLIAQLARRKELGLIDTGLTAIATTYLPSLPDVETMPMATLFTQGINIQRYFFYNAISSITMTMGVGRFRASWHSISMPQRGI